MPRTATYTLDRFLTDVRQVFVSTTDPRAQAQAVAQHMWALLAVPGWLDERFYQLSRDRGQRTFVNWWDSGYAAAIIPSN